MSRSILVFARPAAGVLAWRDRAASPPENRRSGLQVLAPTRQAARALGEPQKSLETLAEQRLRACPDAPTPAPAIARHRLLRQVVAELETPADPEAVATAIAPTVAEFLRAGWDLAALAARTDLPARGRRLARLAGTYRDRLRARGWIDPAERFWAACRVADPAEPLLLYGYGDLRPDALAFWDAVAADGSAIVLGPEARAIADLAARGWTVEDEVVKDKTIEGETIEGKTIDGKTAAIAPWPGIAARAIAHEFPSLDAETRWTLAQVKALLADGVPPRDIALVAGDERRYGEALLDAGWEFETPVRLLFQVPLREARVGAWMDLLLAAIAEDFPFEATTRLLQHPLCGRDLAPGGDGDPRGWWARARRLRPNRRRDWERLKPELGVDLAWLVPPSKRRTLADWNGWLLEVWKQADLQRRANRWPQEAIAFARLKAGLAALERWEDSEGRSRARTLKFAEFLAELRDLLGVLSVPAEPRRTGVELHQPRSLAGASYRHVFVLGLADGLLPPPVADCPVLDFYDRRALAAAGFPLDGPADRARATRQDWAAVLGAVAETLTLTYPAAIAGEPQLPSPYLAALGFDPKSLPAPPPAAIASPEMALQLTLQRPRSPLGSPLHDRARRAWAVERSREDVGAPDAFDGIVGAAIDPRSRTFSASQLLAIGQCGFRWFAARLLRLRELSEAETRFEGRDRGTVYHKVLENLLEPGPFSREACLARLAQVFERVEREYRLDRLAAWKAQRREHLENLRSLLVDSNLFKTDVEILANEYEFEGEWYGLRVTGKVDCLRRTPEGLDLIDYKTSDSVNRACDRYGELKVDVQLPLYLDVAAPHFQSATGAELPVSQARYYNVLGQSSKKAKTDDAEALVKFADRVKQQLATGAYPVRPDRGCEACTYCDSKLVCRVGDRLSRKES